MKIGFISLGCNKNLVDTEKTIAIFQKHGHEVVNDEKKAQIIVINTCGFIQSAKEEAISTILEMAAYKEKNCKYLIVMGCLPQRYKEELEKEIPEVDLYIKYQEYDTLWEQIENLLAKQNHLENKKKKESLRNTSSFLEQTDRVISTGANYAYLKIADGCSNYCTYCAIPKIRGPLVSRKMESIIEEAKKLAKNGYKEIILTAQDTTKYGMDLYQKPMLAQLLKRLCEIEGIKWIRFLYAYPETITDELIDVIQKNEKICSYFDIPVQHIADSVLKRMNRKSDEASIRNLITKLRTKLPNVILRTTVMVGFPGETKEDFEELYDFLQEAKFDKLGAFMFSKEEGTPAEKLKEQVHPKTKQSRYRKIMELQQQIVRQNLEQKVGLIYQVMIEGIQQDKKGEVFYVGRSYMDVPEIDGVIYVKSSKKLTPGEFVKCKITKVKDYDLIAEEV